MTANPELWDALLPVVDALVALDVPYCVGGSVASSFAGVARAARGPGPKEVALDFLSSADDSCSSVRLPVSVYPKLRRPADVPPYLPPA
jgi:hypothetical protein